MPQGIVRSSRILSAKKKASEVIPMPFLYITFEIGVERHAQENGSRADYDVHGHERQQGFSTKQAGPWLAGDRFSGRAFGK